MNFIEIENQFYILASSAFADQETVVLKQGDTFALFDKHGDIHQIGSGSQGIYHQGTRFVSRMELMINNQKPLLLSSSPREDNQMLIVDLTNPDLSMDSENVVLRGNLHILRTKFLWQSAYHEKISVFNFGLEPVRFSMSLLFDADFADIFEVRGSVREKKGKKFSPVGEGNQVTCSYLGLDDLLRKTKFRFSPQPKEIQKNIVTFEANLEIKGVFEIDVSASFSEGKQAADPISFDEAKTGLNAYMEKLQHYCADIKTSNEQFNDWVDRSRSDLITITTQTPQGFYPYAGVPWYSTPFGRDGIITALECLWVEPELAKGVLQYLAHTQARNFNDFQDAEPGKIFHETRGGEMAELGEIPFKLYYGTVDATALFICLAGAYLERTNDTQTLSRIWPNIEMALYWIDNYGDIDGDGFVEYKTKSAKGLTNQGWKDSQDSIFYADGTLATDPIALCEVQGYVYEAKVRAAEIAAALGHSTSAARLEKEAADFKERFNNQFWSEEKQIYYLALDGNKRPCDIVSSNAGHCLFSGIATQERAMLTAARLLSDEMFSGWGIRTIGTREPRYNPMSYHNGSVWPHDNAMIAYGFSRYGLMNEALQVLKAGYDTSLNVRNHRLPELFCGFERVKGKPPTDYPVACSPQAWSVGAVFMMLQACLGLRIQAAKKLITFHFPEVPSFMREITITNLRLNGQVLVIQLRRNSDGKVDAVLLTPDADVIVEVHQHK